jgi:hypothetical protein
MLESSRWSTASTWYGFDPQPGEELGNAAWMFGRSAELAAMTN